MYLIGILLGGGGGDPIKFNNLEEPATKSFSSDAPDWRIINKGLNLEGICKNKNCKAFDKKVWTNKQFGLFNLSKEVYKSPCPICN